MQMSMRMGLWAAMSDAEQQQYLDARGVEVMGYTLTGKYSTPEAVEFRRVRWQFRNADICEATGGWAVYGCTKDQQATRVLEFGEDKDDAIRLHGSMALFGEYFRELWIMQFNLPNTRERHWVSPVFFGASSSASAALRSATPATVE